MPLELVRGMGFNRTFFLLFIADAIRDSVNKTSTKTGLEYFKSNSPVHLFLTLK